MSNFKMKYSTTWENHYFILYKINSDQTLTALCQPKPIILCSNRHNEQFYGIRSTRYGMRVPPECEYWGIFNLIDDEWIPQIQGTIPSQYSRQIIPLNDGRIVYIRKSKTNISFSISINRKFLIVNKKFFVVNKKKAKVTK